MWLTSSKIPQKGLGVGRHVESVFSEGDLHSSLFWSYLSIMEEWSILKEMNPEYSLDGLMLKLKPQYFGHLMSSADSLEDPDAGQDWGQGDKEVKKDKMVGGHHQLNGHEFEQTPGDSEGQGGLENCNPWGRKELDMP